MESEVGQSYEFCTASLTPLRDAYFKRTENG